MHPTQLYEAFFLAALALWLIRERREGTSDRTVLGLYFLFAGGFRFLLEFVRINEPVLLSFTLAQVFALLLAAIGTAFLYITPLPRRTR